MTIQQQVHNLKEKGFTPKQIFDKLTEAKVETTINSVRWYCSQAGPNKKAKAAAAKKGSGKKIKAAKPATIKKATPKKDKKVVKAKKVDKPVKTDSKGFSPIPGYSKYESNGKIVRNAKTYKVSEYKTGTKKYQLLSDAGPRLTLTIEEINKLYK